MPQTPEPGFEYRIERALEVFRALYGNRPYNRAQARLALNLAERLSPALQLITAPFLASARTFVDQSMTGPPETELRALWDEIERLEGAAGMEASSFVLRALTCAFFVNSDMFRDGSEYQFIDLVVFGCENHLGMSPTAIEHAFALAFASPNDDARHI